VTEETDKIAVIYLCVGAGGRGGQHLGKGVYLQNERKSEPCRGTGLTHRYRQCLCFAEVQVAESWEHKQAIADSCADGNQLISLARRCPAGREGAALRMTATSMPGCVCVGASVEASQGAKERVHTRCTPRQATTPLLGRPSSHAVSVTDGSGSPAGWPAEAPAAASQFGEFGVESRLNL